MPTYAAWGLVLEADFPIPELTPAVGRADVVVRLDSVPKRLSRVTARGALYQCDGTRLLLELDGVARYLVDGGREIVVQPAAAAAWCDVRLFLLGSCMAALLQQRGLLVLHAAAVRTAAGGVLLCGPSGVGKSTLLMALAQRGSAVLADDVAALDLRSGSISVLPAFPVVRLWEDAAVALGLDPTALPRTRAALRKYDAAAPAFAREPVEVRRIDLLAIHDRDSVDVAVLAAAAARDALSAQLYQQGFLDGFGLLPQTAERIAAVSESVPVRLVHRPRLPRLAELAAAVEGTAGDR